MNNQIVIVDYGMGNIGSVQSAFRDLNVSTVISRDRSVLVEACGIVLPGVGAFPSAIRNICNFGLDEALSEAVLKRRIPFLGICLGMQLIGSDSDEQGFSKGLGWVDGQVRRIEVDHTLPLPHVGWNSTRVVKMDPFFKNLEGDPHFFFDHSYHFRCSDDLVAATCDYGVEIVAAIQRDNIFAVQFHPEKSQRSGLRMLRNFANLACETMK